MNALVIRRRGRSWLAILAAVLLTNTLSHAQATAGDVRYYSQQAAKAYEEKNYAAYLENMRMAVGLRPDNPVLLYNLAGALALAGKGREALEGLLRVAEMGMTFQPEADSDFNSIKESEEFKAILKRFEANKARVGRSTTAFTVHQKGLITEGLAYDPAEGAFYVGSVREREILKITRDGNVKEFATQRDGLWSAMGMKVDARRRVLWVATAAVPQMADYSKEEDGQSGLLKFDLQTGKLIRKYILPNTKAPHWLGDLTVNSRGDVYTTDSLTPALYVLREGGGHLESLIEGAPFVSPQGLDFSYDEKSLYIADYAKGLFLYDVKSGHLSQLRAPPNVTLVGLDGLYFYGGNLIAVQNGTRPHRIVRIILSSGSKRVRRLEVVEANNPLFDEPTLGVLVRDSFYYIADSQWGAIDKNGKLAPEEKLREPVILKTRL